MSNPIVSIIVPSYNQGEFLSETLDSVLAQTYPHWECIIVNDGSVDNTEIVAQQYCKQDTRFRYFYQENKGVSAARNNAIRKSHGQYILPLDGDDLIAPQYIEKAITYFEKFPETNLVYCKAKYIGDREGEWQLPNYSYKTMLFNNPIFCSCIYRRNDYDKTKGYNLNMGAGLEDWDFLLSLLTDDSKVYKISEILFFYRRHGTSRNTEMNEHRMKIYNQIVANHVDVYFPFLHRVIGEEYYKTELEKILKSQSYRLGKIILSPLRWIKKLIKKDNSKYTYLFL